MRVDHTNWQVAAMDLNANEKQLKTKKALRPTQCQAQSSMSCQMNHWQRYAGQAAH
jgi:hypothetical protein